MLSAAVKSCLASGRCLEFALQRNASRSLPSGHWLHLLPKLDSSAATRPLHLEANEKNTEEQNSNIVTAPPCDNVLELPKCSKAANVILKICVQASDSLRMSMLHPIPDALGPLCCSVFLQDFPNTVFSYIKV